MNGRDGARRLSLALFLVTLVGGTTTAFALTEALKLEPSPIGRPRIDEVLSPGCRCPQRTARLSVRLKKADTIDVGIVDGDGESVRTLASGSRRAPGRIRFRWNARNDAGEIVPDGAYRLRIDLARADRTIVVPETVNVESEPRAASEAAVAFRALR